MPGEGKLSALPPTCLWDSFADTAFFLGLGEGLSFTFLVMMMIFLFNPGL